MEGLRPGWTVKVIIVIMFSSILFRCVSATNHSVGGPSGWDLTSNLQAWSASTTFYTGDVLVFSYGPIHDVLEVNRLDFATCMTINPISTHNNGETVVPLTEAGTRYFICGRRGHCAMGLRLRLQVLPPPPPPPGNAPTPAESSSSSSNGTHPGGDGGGNKHPPPPSPLHVSLPPHHAETPTPRRSGVGNMMMEGFVYWCLPFIALVIIS